RSRRSWPCNAPVRPQRRKPREAFGVFLWFAPEALSTRSLIYRKPYPPGPGVHPDPVETKGVHTVNQPGRETVDVLQELSEAVALSGYEGRLAQKLKELLSPFVDEIHIDALGNLTAVKRGEGGSSPPVRVMWAAHMDEIGFVVTKIEKGGFLRVSNVGGIDIRNVLSQEVTVHGRQDLPGVLGAKPPHLTTADERQKPVPLDELFVDVGLSEERARELVAPGDLISFRRPFRRLQGQRVTGKSLDNRASVASLYHALKVLQGLRHTA